MAALLPPIIYLVAEFPEISLPQEATTYTGPNLVYEELCLQFPE